jgi:chromosomal replication initiation ATPase DnaA
MTPALAQQHEAHKARIHRMNDAAMQFALRPKLIPKPILKGMTKPLWFSIEADAVHTIENIQRVVAGRYGVSRLDILSSRRPERIVAPRRIAMYLAHKLTNHASGAIGRQFDRDHTTILAAVKKVERMMRADGELRAQVAALEAVLAA